MATPKTFTKQVINTTSDQDALQIKDVKGDILGWIDSSGTGQGNLASGGGGGTPGGSNTQVQYNNNGSFGGANNFNVVSGTVGLGTGNTPGQIDNAANGYNGAAGVSTLDVVANLTSPTQPNGVAANIVSSMEVNSTADNAGSIYSLWATNNIPATNAHNFTQINASFIAADHFGSGSVAQLAAIVAAATNDSTGAVSNLIGCIINAGNVNGPVTNNYGQATQVGAFGTGTITNARGLYIQSPGTSAVISHNHGIHVADQTGGGSNNPDSWAIFVAAAADKSQLGTFRTGQFTVAALPSGIEGLQAYATNGRKVGEGPGSGTGVPVYFSNGSWRVFSTDAAVQA